MANESVVKSGLFGRALGSAKKRAGKVKRAMKPTMAEAERSAGRVAENMAGGDFEGAMKEKVANQLAHEAGDIKNASKNGMEYLGNLSDKGYTGVKRDMMKNYFSDPVNGSARKKVVGGVAAAGVGLAVADRYANGGTLLREKNGDFDIAGVPII